jgi:hypothetical protein
LYHKLAPLLIEIAGPHGRWNGDIHDNGQSRQRIRAGFVSIVIIGASDAGARKVRGATAFRGR